MAQQRTWLEVPFEEEDVAKPLGARWDPQARSWYVPGPVIPPQLARWAPRAPIPTLLPGEDRNFGTGLFVDLIPTTCWFTNVRYCVERRDWERLRRMVLDRAEQRCEACGAQARRHQDRDLDRPLEVHERWHYDTSTPRRPVQSLRRLICLCRSCHQSTHFGLAQVQGRDAAALAHLVEVTGMTHAQARRHVDDAFATWRARNQRRWTLNLDMLTTAGITLAPPPDATDRASVADRELHRRRG